MTVKKDMATEVNASEPATGHVLIAHAQDVTAASLAKNLERSGYITSTTNNGYVAWSRALHEVPDLILLDWRLPGLASDELSRRLRGHQVTRNVKIFALCETASEPCKLFDACIPGPYSTDQLIAKVNYALKRRRSLDMLFCGDIEVDPAAHRVRRGGKSVQISGHAYKLLCFLMQNPDLVHTRERLRDRVWGESSKIEERTIDAHVVRLRRALFQSDDVFPLRTVKGVGYALESKAE